MEVKSLGGSLGVGDGGVNSPDTRPDFFDPEGLTRRDKRKTCEVTSLRSRDGREPKATYFHHRSFSDTLLYIVFCLEYLNCISAERYVASVLAGGSDCPGGIRLKREYFVWLMETERFYLLWWLSA